MEKRITGIRKRLISLLAALVLLMGRVPAVYAEETGLENFRKVNSYIPGQFTDVAADAWYADSVKIGYELGLIKGSSETGFNPAGSMTLAEAITLAARLHSIYNTGAAAFVQGNPWYQVYVDYASANGIVQDGAYANYSATVTRAQFAAIFASALPAAALAKINDVISGMIPDVTSSESYGEAVYRLYQAGVLTGSDEYGTFNPDSGIQRSEVAAIVTRMADKSLRKSVTLKEKPVALETIALDQTNCTLLVGDTVQLKPVYTPVNATEKAITWNSSDSAVAKVSEDGTVTAVAAGTALITVCAAEGKSASCTVTVKEIEVTSVTMNQTKLELTVGESAVLRATVYPDEASNKSVTWTSSNPYIAEVSASGEVTAKFNGDVIITATAANGQTASCTVSVSRFRIIVQNSFPCTLYYYSGLDGLLMESAKITDCWCWYSSENMLVEYYVSGEKTYDWLGVDHRGSCGFSWKLMDSEGYVVDSGGAYPGDYCVGDRFKDYRFRGNVRQATLSGVYTLVLMDHR